MLHLTTKQRIYNDRIVVVIVTKEEHNFVVYLNLVQNQTGTIMAYTFTDMIRAEDFRNIPSFMKDSQYLHLFIYYRRMKISSLCKLHPLVSYHIDHNTHKPNSYSHYNLLILLPHFSGANDGSIQSSDKAAVQKTHRLQANYVCYYCRTNYLWHSDVAMCTTLLPHVSTMIVDIVSSVATEISM